MFTGIVEHVGTIVQCRDVPGGRKLRINLGPLASDCHHGDSICINGVCLTVSSLTPPLADFDVIHETLSKTTLGAWTDGNPVNLERSLLVGSRVDGHFVQGHVDGMATVEGVVSSPRENVVTLRSEAHLRSYLIPKGSVSLDGVSLTIAAIKGACFTVALIPTTLERTTLSRLKSGARVNVETDMIVRTIVHRLSSPDHAGGLKFDALQKAGFA